MIYFLKSHNICKPNQQTKVKQEQYTSNNYEKVVFILKFISIMKYFLSLHVILSKWR